MSAASGPAGMKRFYSNAAVATGEGGYRVELDGRGINTPAGRKLTLPTLPLAEAVASEWNGQGETIDVHSLRLTRIANSVLDGVLGREAEVAEEIAGYGASDLLCYRATGPAELAARQSASWDPVLGWASDALGVSLLTTAGITWCEQPETSLTALRENLGRRNGWELAALHVMTGLLGSAMLALAHAEGKLTAEEAWAAAHIDEDWQISQWGEDYEARKRRENRQADFLAASRLYALCSGQALSS